MLLENEYVIHPQEFQSFDEVSKEIEVSQSQSSQDKAFYNF